MLSAEYQGTDPKGWLVSEKYDGVRAIWDGAKLYSREGNEFFAPEFFLRSLPYGQALDGELWMGRGTYLKMLSVAMSKAGDWRDVRFMAFDLPLENVPSNLRIELLSGAVPNEFFKIAPHWTCDGCEHLEGIFREIKENGGEGAMLRRPDSKYIFGRSTNLQKLKKPEQLA